MARLYVVRNARTEEGTGFVENPGLDEVGRVQAEAVASLLGSRPRMPILCSPQRRALETVQPLAQAWFATPVIDESVSLMPLPDPQSCNLLKWLTDFMRQRWPEAPEAQQHWRAKCLDTLTHIDRDTVVVSHFIVVNMIVGAALDDTRVTVFQPDNGSITILDIADGRLSLVERGRQAATRRL